MLLFFNCIWIFKHGRKAFPPPEVSRKPRVFFPGTFGSLLVSLPLFCPSLPGRRGRSEDTSPGWNPENGDRPRTPSLRPSSRQRVACAASERLTRVAAGLLAPGGREEASREGTVLATAASDIRPGCHRGSPSRENFTEPERQLNVCYGHFQTHAKAENTTNLCVPTSQLRETWPLC